MLAYWGCAVNTWQQYSSHSIVAQRENRAMLMPTSPKVREEMIRQALKEKAPKMYRELERSGKLEKFLGERDWDMMEAYSQDRMAVSIKAAEEGRMKKDWLKATRDQNAALSQLAEQVLATWLEFSDPPTAESGRSSKT